MMLTMITQRVRICPKRRRMSLEELRENNKAAVVERALALFREKGIEQTTVRDIAAAAGLTERSVYRYFDGRADIVLAASFLFWQMVIDRTARMADSEDFRKATGLEQIRALLGIYSHLIFTDPDGVRFILDAEVCLYHAGLQGKLRNRPPEAFEHSQSPMVRAIAKGLGDGSISPTADVKMLYYGAYDAILGTMERIALDATSAHDTDNQKRMEYLCQLFVRSFENG